MYVYVCWENVEMVETAASTNLYTRVFNVRES